MVDHILEPAAAAIAEILADERARQLTAAGVHNTAVRYNGIMHDFMMLNPLRETAASTAAVEQAIHISRKELGQ